MPVLLPGPNWELQATTVAGSQGQSPSNKTKSYSFVDKGSRLNSKVPLAVQVKAIQKLPPSLNKQQETLSGTLLGKISVLTVKELPEGGRLVAWQQSLCALVNGRQVKKKMESRIDCFIRLDVF